jgi:hypothetical protein
MSALWCIPENKLGEETTTSRLVQEGRVHNYTALNVERRIPISGRKIGGMLDYDAPSSASILEGEGLSEDATVNKVARPGGLLRHGGASIWSL